MGLLFTNEDKYNAVILKVSQETGTPYAYIKGFVALESAFNEKAYRYEPHINDASYGLAQILNRTARGVGFKGEPAELFEPYKSVLYGAKFIGQLAKKYPNVLDLIAAYNMGFPRKITATTQLIADIYKYPIEYRERPPQGWVYANEPYVRRVASYIAYYQAREKNDVALAEKILDLIKKKDLTIASSFLNRATSAPAPAPASPAGLQVSSAPAPAPAAPGIVAGAVSLRGICPYCHKPL